MWMGSNPPRFYWAGPQLPEPIAAVVDDARVSTGCSTAHFSSIPEVCSENICRVHFFLTEADRSCIQNITPTCRFWIYSTIKVKNINNSTQTMKRRKKKRQNKHSLRESTATSGRRDAPPLRCSRWDEQLCGGRNKTASHTPGSRDAPDGIEGRASLWATSVSEHAKKKKNKKTPPAPRTSSPK